MQLLKTLSLTLCSPFVIGTIFASNIDCTGLGNISDSNVCTVDTCVIGQGVVHINTCQCESASDCDDNDPCTGIESCDTLHTCQPAMQIMSCEGYIGGSPTGNTSIGGGGNNTNGNTSSNSNPNPSTPTNPTLMPQSNPNPITTLINIISNKNPVVPSAPDDVYTPPTGLPDRISTPTPTNTSPTPTTLIMPDENKQPSVPNPQNPIPRNSPTKPYIPTSDTKGTHTSPDIYTPPLGTKDTNKDIYTPPKTPQIALVTLKQVMQCQNGEINTNTLSSCLAKMPKTKDCPSCIAESERYREPYTSVPGSLYIEREDAVSFAYIQKIAEFLSQFMTIKVSQPLQPYTQTIRIDVDPSQIDNAKLYGLLIHLMDEKTANLFEPTISPVPMFRVASEQMPVFKTESTIKSDPRIKEQTYYKTLGFDPKNPVCIAGSEARTDPITIAVVDNAFPSHKDLMANVIYTYDASTKDSNVQPPATSDERGHGTNSAGIIGAITNNGYGIYALTQNNVKLSLYKSAKNDGDASDLAFAIEALAKAGESKPDIINASRGIFSTNNIPVLEKVIKKIREQGTIIIASAGNYNKSDLFYPAAYPDVIAVGAIDQQYKKASFSNYGDWVDIGAPGVGIMTTSNGEGYIMEDGTSASAPVAVASLAYIMRYGGTRDDIIATMTPHTLPLGKGRINLANTCKDLMEHPREHSTASLGSNNKGDIGNKFATKFTTQSMVKTNKNLFFLVWVILFGLVSAFIYHNHFGKTTVE